MNTIEMIELKKSNRQIFEELMEEKFGDFSFNYYSVFKMLLSGEDITPLFKMLEAINYVNMGKKDLESAEEDIGKYLTKFLPSELLNKVENNSKEINKKKK